MKRKREPNPLSNEILESNSSIIDINQDIKVPEQYKCNRIMVVDDEEFCISAMKILLQSFGINNQQIDFCINGQESVDILKKQMQKGMQYKCILTDFSMPIMDGIQATKHMRSYMTD